MRAILGCRQRTVLSGREIPPWARPRGQLWRRRGVLTWERGRSRHPPRTRKETDRTRVPQGRPLRSGLPGLPVAAPAQPALAQRTWKRHEQSPCRVSLGRDRNAGFGELSDTSVRRCSQTWPEGLGAGSPPSSVPAPLPGSQDSPSPHRSANPLGLPGAKGPSAVPLPSAASQTPPTLVVVTRGHSLGPRVLVPSAACDSQGRGGRGFLGHGQYSQVTGDRNTRAAGPEKTRRKRKEKPGSREGSFRPTWGGLRRVGAGSRGQGGRGGAARAGAGRHAGTQAGGERMSPCGHRQVVLCKDTRGERVCTRNGRREGAVTADPGESRRARGHGRDGCPTSIPKAKQKFDSSKRSRGGCKGRVGCSQHNSCNQDWLANQGLNTSI